MPGFMVSCIVWYAQHSIARKLKLKLTPAARLTSEGSHRKSLQKKVPWTQLVTHVNRVRVSEVIEAPD